MSDWLLYGATGYTGQLIAEESARRGLRPVLGGRDAKKLEPIASRLGLPMRIFSLDDHAEMVDALSGAKAVLHCAGPFSRTSAPMIEACLQARCHYLDITGEIGVIEHAAAQNDRAKQAGITVMPAVGFDVVPSDCLAKALAERLPSATHLTLAFTALEGVSPGTLKTMLEAFPHGGMARVNGRIESVPFASKRREIPFHSRTRTAVSLPWGDVASAFYTTGIPNIETYCGLPGAQSRIAKYVPALRSLLKPRFVRTSLEWMIDQLVSGPNAKTREASRCSFWGEVRDDAGHSVEGTLETMGGYALTIHAALACLDEVLAGRAPTGFCTPAGAFGADLVKRIPGTELILKGPGTSSSR
jgi:short subunit dehydrogenase-like uncharacterized protein